MEMEQEITMLQKDAMDQDAVDTEQQRKIDHLEKLMEDLGDRLNKVTEQVS
jgi:hypothetical protein